MVDTVRIRRVLLLGFMCSGKSTVGRSLARRLEWDLFDFDVEIEMRTGMPIGEIVVAHGEEYFRDLEVELTAEIQGGTRLVIAPGGGWITNPGVFDLLRDGTLSAWLKVSAQETVRRLREDPTDRPFKNHPNPLQPIEQMLAVREPLYGQADHTLPGDGRSSETVAFELEQLVRGRFAPGSL